MKKDNKIVENEVAKEQNVAEENVSENETVTGANGGTGTATIMPKAKGGFKLPKMPKFNFKPFFRGFKVSIWLEVALLIAREMIPEMENKLPSVYSFLDKIAVPVINWAYAFGQKIIEMVIDLPVIRDFIQWLAGLV